MDSVSKRVARAEAEDRLPVVLVVEDEVLIRMAIAGAHRNKRPIGICGQAPSDYPEYAEFLVKAGIDSISLNPDSVLGAVRRVLAIEAARS